MRESSTRKRKSDNLSGQSIKKSKENPEIDPKNTAEKDPRLAWIEIANTDRKTIATAMANNNDFIAYIVEEVLPDAVNYSDLPNDSKIKLVIAVQEAVGNAADKAPNHDANSNPKTSATAMTNYRDLIDDIVQELLPDSVKDSKINQVGNADDKALQQEKDANSDSETIISDPEKIIKDTTNDEDFSDPETIIKDMTNDEDFSDPETIIKDMTNDEDFSDPETIIKDMTNDEDFIKDIAQRVLPKGVEFSKLPEDSQVKLVFAVRDSVGQAAKEGLQKEQKPGQSNDQANKLLQQQAAERFLQQQNLDRTFALNQYAAGERTYLEVGDEAMLAENLIKTKEMLAEEVAAENLEYKVANDTMQQDGGAPKLDQPPPKPGAASDESKESVGNIVQAIRAEKMQTTTAEGVEKGNEGGFASRIMDRLESHHESKNSSPSTIPTPSIPTGD